MKRSIDERRSMIAIHNRSRMECPEMLWAGFPVLSVPNVSLASRVVIIAAAGYVDHLHMARALYPPTHHSFTAK
jgi:hypothetical protein